MGFADFFSKASGGSGDTKLFLALLITDTTIQAGFWQIGQASITLLEKSPVRPYSDGKDLLVQADSALQTLGKASENVDEVILGLEFNWVGQEGIADIKKPILKQLVQDLSLKPVGFVVSTEALFHFLAHKDPQISTLLVQYSSDHVTVSIINRGKLINSERVGRSDDAGADVQEATARLLSNQEHASLPPRVHLVSSTLSQAEIKEQKSQLSGFDWKTINPKIAHQPIVEVLPGETILEAVIQEGGKAVAESQGISISNDLDKAVSSQSEDESDSIAAESETNEELRPHQPPKFVSNDFTTPDFAQESTYHDADDKVADDDYFEQPAKPTSQLQLPKVGLPPAIGNWMRHHLTFVIGGFIAGLLALVVIGVTWISTAKQAVVALQLNAQSISGDVTITLDPTIASSRPEELLIKAEVVTTEITESKTIPTTGVTLVGERAKGKVSVINKTDQERTIAAGTQLTTGSLVFTLDEEVKVASASVSQNNNSETKTYGKTEAAATASKIGADSNIAANTTLSVGTFAESSVTAEAVAAFSGGASREVRVFSQEDADALTNSLSKTILEKAETEFRSQSGAGVYTIPTGQLDIDSEDFDAEVDDEVSTVTLSLTATATGVRYQIADVKALVATALADKIPEGFVLSDKEPSILTKPSEQAASTTASSARSAATSRVVLDANISAQVVPTFNQDEFKQQIQNQSVSSAEAILRGRSEVKEATVTLQPPIAQTFSNSVPSKPDKITIEVTN